MTPIRFALIGPDGTVLRRIRAQDAADARAILRPTPVQLVVSQASLDVTPVRPVVVVAVPLPPRATCSRCRCAAPVAPARVCARCQADAKARKRVLGAAAQRRMTARLTPEQRAARRTPALLAAKAEYLIAWRAARRSA